MKKVVISGTVLTLLFLAFSVYAYSSDTSTSYSGQTGTARQQFLSETRDLRQSAHDLRCELQTAYQSSTPDQQKIAGLKSQIAGLRQQIQSKAQALGVTLPAGNGQRKPLTCPGVVP